jgi:hypothetical protein
MRTWKYYRKEYESDVHTRIAGAKNTMLAMAAPLESAPFFSEIQADSCSRS